MRAYRKVKIRDTHGNWIETMGIFPDDQLCAHPDCIKITTTTQRRQSKKTSQLTHCSAKCRVENMKLISARKKEQSLLTGTPPTAG